MIKEGRCLYCDRKTPNGESYCPDRDCRERKSRANRSYRSRVNMGVEDTHVFNAYISRIKPRCPVCGSEISAEKDCICQ